MSEPADTSLGRGTRGDERGEETQPGVRRAQLAARLTLAAIYVGFGVIHLRSANSFLPIMPPGIPHPREVVLFTGACEIAGGVGLMLPPTRRLAGVMLAVYALAVWPANIWHAFSGAHVPPLPSSWWYHGPRIAFQPVLMWWALFAGGVTGWPFPSTPGRRMSVTAIVNCCVAIGFVVLVIALIRRRRR